MSYKEIIVKLARKKMELELVLGNPISDASFCKHISNVAHIYADIFKKNANLINRIIKCKPRFNWDDPAYKIIKIAKQPNLYTHKYAYIP